MGETSLRRTGRHTAEEGQKEQASKRHIKRGKLITTSWGYALDESPLLLKETFYTSVFCLQMLERHPSHGFHQCGPSPDCLHQPFCVRRLVNNEAA